jgi:hypothetical protein
MAAGLLSGSIFHGVPTGSTGEELLPDSSCSGVVFVDTETIAWPVEAGAKASWLTRFQEALSRFDGNVWPETAPPAIRASKTAYNVLESLWRANRTPDRIAPAADGGVVVYLFGETGYILRADPSGDLIVTNIKEPASRVIPYMDGDSLRAILEEVGDITVDGSAAEDVSSSASG